MNNFNDLPIEIQTKILNYLVRCKFDNNLFINKEIHNKLNLKYKKCKFIKMFGKKICSECWKKEVNQISMLFSSNLF